VYLAVDVDKSLAPLGKGVRNRNADTVKPTRNLVRPFVELAAGMEPGHNQLQGTDLFGRVDVHRNTTTVVLHPDNVVTLQNHQDLRTETLHGLVNGVVHDLENQVVKAVDTRGTNVHTRPLANGLQTL